MGVGYVGQPLILAVGLATAVATLCGGFLALRYRTAYTLLLGFSGGAVVGVALFDLLPEAGETGAAVLGTVGIALCLAAGFATYCALDRAGAMLTGAAGSHRGHLAAASLTAHSLMDGLGIGFGFQVSASVGAVVAAAVLAHDVLDGANTVAVNLRGGGDERSARLWLVADAAAPLVGIGLASLASVPDAVLAGLLAAFAGVFLFIGLCDLLPRAYARGPVVRTAAAMGLGLAFIYAVVRLAG
jgi:zinc transporter ZupT